MLSNRQIDILGEKLKAEKNLSTKELDDLLEWRNSFSPTMDYYYTRLKNKIEEDTTVAIAKRVKRIESIKIKLKRFSTMRLSTLQDIAGLRAILKDPQALNSAYNNLRNAETVNKLKKLDDYHHRPKEDGYRGIHLIFRTSNSRMVEIQLRTELEHIWATAVEIYGTLKMISFKTGQGDTQWKEFFKYLSSFFALHEGFPVLEEHNKFNKKQITSKLKKIIKDLNVIEILNAATNNIDIVVNKRAKGRTGKYALLELDYINNTTHIDIFTKKQVKLAIEEYTRKELSFEKDSGKNIVFVNIDSMDSIKKSYPNYFLNTQKLLKILSSTILTGVFKV